MQAAFDKSMERQLTIYEFQKNARLYRGVEQEQRPHMVS